MPLLGLTERKSSYKKWFEIYSECYCWLHLSNEHVSEITCSFVKYKTLSTSIQCSVKREIIYNEIECSYDVYELYADDRKIFIQKETEFGDQRYGYAHPWDFYKFYRNLIEEKVNFDKSIHCISRRYCSYSSTSPYSNRYFYVKPERWTERYGYTFPLRTESYITSRYFYGSTLPSDLYTQRLIYVEGYSEKIEFVVGDDSHSFPYFWYTININPIEHSLFESKNVISEDMVSKITVVDLPDMTTDRDILMIYIPPGKDNYNSINFTHSSLFDLSCYKLTDHTLIFDGYLIFPKMPIKLAFTLLCENYPDYKSGKDYYDNYVNRHDYYKITVGEYEFIEQGIFSTYMFPINSPIPFKIYLFDELVLNGNNMVRMEWYYPQQVMKKCETTFLLTM